MVTFNKVILMGSFLIIATRGDGHHNLPHLTSQRTSQATQHMQQKKSTRRPGAVRPISESSNVFLYILHFILSKNDNSNGVVCTDTHSHAHLFKRFGFQTHLGAPRALSAFLWFKVGWSTSFHPVILADLPLLSETETTSTTWASCDQLAHILLRVNSALFGGMNISLHKHML